VFDPNAWYFVVPENIHTSPTEGFFHLNPPPYSFKISIPEGFVKTHPPLQNFFFSITLISEPLGKFLRKVVFYMENWHIAQLRSILFIAF